MSADSPSKLVPLLSLLERDNLVTQFSHDKKPSIRILLLRRESHQLIVQRPSETKKVVEEVVNLATVKEIRIGQNSLDFQRWPEEAGKYELSSCFIVVYGTRFCLKNLSVAVDGPNAASDCNVWIQELRNLISSNDPPSTSRIIQLERWLHEKYFAFRDELLLKPQNILNLNKIKSAIFPIGNQYGKQVFKEFRCSMMQMRAISRTLSFEHFVDWYWKLHDYVTHIDFDVYFESDGFMREAGYIRFLNESQYAYTSQGIGEHLKEWYDFFEGAQPGALLPDCGVIAQIQQGYVSRKQFLEFLFSSHNNILDPKTSQVTQDMSQPLSNYWISSSHNTYLTGHQITGQSSVEAYARCLQLGCRCIELDCWDGPDNEPIIYHGHTLTSKIKFIDVIRTIKDYAFVASEYPLVLSFEEHCCVEQQRKMAQYMIDVFGPLLLTSDDAQLKGVNPNYMPSPNDLKKKIVIKHKRLPALNFQLSNTQLEVDDSSSDRDVSLLRTDSTESTNKLEEDCWEISRSKKTGVMYVEDMYGDWLPGFFTISGSKLLCTEIDDNDCDSSSDDEWEIGEGVTLRRKSSAQLNEIHDFIKSRQEAEEALAYYGSFNGDGTYLIRETQKIEGYILSIWHNSGRRNIHHCKIYRTQSVSGTFQYKINNSEIFDSVTDLIEAYRRRTLPIEVRDVILGEPIPFPGNYTSREWFHNVNKDEAIQILRRIPKVGAYLIRPSEGNPMFNTYSVSFRGKAGEIRHCRVQQMQERCFVVGNDFHETLENVVLHYRKHSLYRDIKLRHPVTVEIIKKSYSLDFVPDDQGRYESIKKCYDLTGAKVTVRSKPRNVSVKSLPSTNTTENSTRPSKRRTYESRAGSPQWIIAIKFKTSNDVLTLGIDHDDEAIPWLSVIAQSSDLKNDVSNNQSIVTKEPDQQEIESEAQQVGTPGASPTSKIEKAKRIAREMSDLTVYCGATPFCRKKFEKDGLKPRELCSFSELKAEKEILGQPEFFAVYHGVMLSRIYPKAARIDSSNYNPVPFWNAGCQMVALNYQTPDKSMQLNDGRFIQNGGCGYVLKPDYLINGEYNPNADDPSPEESMNYTFKIIGGRHLKKPNSRGVVSPSVEVEIIGNKWDTERNRYQTKQILENGLNPNWNETFEFLVTCPSLALLRFAVYDTDVFREQNMIAQATLPLTCIRPGFRSVQLKNGYGEPLALASLLVHVRTTRASAGAHPPAAPAPAAVHALASEQSSTTTTS